MKRAEFHAISVLTDMVDIDVLDNSFMNSIAELIYYKLWLIYDILMAINKN